MTGIVTDYDAWKILHALAHVQKKVVNPPFGFGSKQFIQNISQNRSCMLLLQCKMYGENFVKNIRLKSRVICSNPTVELSKRTRHFDRKQWYNRSPKSYFNDDSMTKLNVSFLR
jgi:hypothetical protein